MASYLSNSLSYAWSWCCDGTDSVKTAITVSAVLLIISWYLLVIRNMMKQRSPPLPPGPWGFPIIGHIPFIKEDLHRFSIKLAETYGPIFKLRLGGKLCIFVTTPALAKEVLRDNDTIFANREVTATGRNLTYGGINILFSPNGPNHRMLRKVCAREVFSPASLDALYSLRLSEVRRMVRYVYENSGKPINIAEQMFLTNFNLITNMLWGATALEEEDRSSAEFRAVVLEVFDLLGCLNVSDIFPVLGPLDVQGYARRMKKLSTWFDGVFNSIIDKRMKTIGAKDTKGKERKDLLQFLLDLKDEGDPKAPFTIDHVKALFVDMIVAGTHTSSTVVEWAITEMIQNKHKMVKAQKELEEVVGIGNTVEEFHIPKLHYLEAVIKEVQRLHPVAPLLIPRYPSESCTVGGFRIPKGCQVMVNVWAIHRDPKIWHDPLEFQPERFLDNTSKFDYSGNDFRYMPFGSGRRICIGSPMAERMLMHVCALLLHSFDWQLPEGTTIDFSEHVGLAANKAIPLLAIPNPRLTDPKLYT